MNFEEITDSLMESFDLKDYAYVDVWHIVHGKLRDRSKDTLSRNLKRTKFFILAATRNILDTNIDNLVKETANYYRSKYLI